MNVNFDVNRLLQAVDRFPNTTALVVGDVMLDEFIWGKVARISPEAPVPVVDVTEESKLLGGAANVVNNVISAGGRCLLSGVVGDDGYGRLIISMLEDLGLATGGMILDSNRPTTMKTRVVAHHQQVVRIDREKRLPLSPEVLDRVIAYVEAVAKEADAVIISDYGKGVVNETLVRQVRRIFREKIVVVDPKVQNFHLYRDATIITPNHHEAAQGAGLVVDSEAALVKAGWKIMEDLNCDAVLITRGEQGMTLFEKGLAPIHIPTVAREVFDVTGAGDTVIGILTLGQAAGLTRLEAAVLANFAAGVVVGEVGTSAVTADGLKEIVLQSMQSRRLVTGKKLRRSSGGN